ncbi:MAG: MBL fold metallo-hydrolase [Candidatus Margulisbacteria bacterium]|nr:MBL fold metallo-hydrolase [Candidatus Margulisiibacteriota bacterium]
MQIRNIKVGRLATNCYIVFDDSKEALVIDPGEEPEKILPELVDLKPQLIVLTHGHYDHATHCGVLKEKLNIPIAIHEDEIKMLAFATRTKADRLLKDGEIIEVGCLKFEVISTPGHTRGGLCLYNKEHGVLFSGDTLFAGTCGRCDFPTGSEEEMAASLRRLLALPPETRVLPGHGRETSIAAERCLINEYGL